MRALLLALVLVTPAGCGEATIGGPLDEIDAVDAVDAAEDQDPIDARPAADARPVDARACVDGAARVVDPSTGHCLIYVGTPTSWPDARTSCIGLGGQLATVNTQTENGLLLGLPIEVVAEPDVWLGASDGVIEGTFVWLTGEAMLYTNWRTGEPNNGGDSGTQEDCAIMEADTAAGTWDDRPCTSLYPYFCELS